MHSLAAMTHFVQTIKNHDFLPKQFRLERVLMLANYLQKLQVKGFKKSLVPIHLQWYHRQQSSHPIQSWMLPPSLKHIWHLSKSLVLTDSTKLSK